MIYLLSASLLWSFAFGLIKTNLVGVPPLFLGGIRALIAFIFFSPLVFFTFKKINKFGFLKILVVGVLEYGLPYALYLKSYQYLKAYQIALFLTFTPFYVTLLNDLFARRFYYKNLIVALLAIGGASLINFGQGEFNNVMKGFILLQLADMGFALGQLLYKKWKVTIFNNLKDHELIPWVILGGLIPLAVMYFFTEATFSYEDLNVKQWSVIFYLAIGSTGLAYLFFNIGINKVSTGVLAVMNNLKIPLAVLWSIVIFGEVANISYLKFISGSILIILALYLAYKNQVNQKV